MNATLLAIIELETHADWTFGYAFRQGCVEQRVIRILHNNLHHTGMTFDQAYSCLERYVFLSNNVLLKPVVS